VLHVLLFHLHATINLKQYIMKKLIYLLTLSLLVCMSCSTEETEIMDQEDLSKFKEVNDFFKAQQANSANELHRGGNNGNGVYFVPFISDAFEEWTLAWPVPNTSLVMYLEYPQNGEDRLLIYSGEEMMLNWTSQEPRVFMVDLNDGIVKYSNWCDENKTGFFHINGKSTWYPIDLDGDGETDIYGWNLGTLGKNFNMKVKTTVTDSQITDTWIYPVQGDCRTATEELEFTYKSNVSNGAFTETATFR
jgi:hypothetical protein